jgi:hypothetical protein
MDDEGNHEPEQAQKWSYCANNGSPSGAHSPTYSASANDVQGCRQNGGGHDAHDSNSHDRHENCEASHRTFNPRRGFVRVKVYTGDELIVEIKR